MMRIERIEWDGARRRAAWRAGLRSLAPASPRSAPRSRTILAAVAHARRRGVCASWRCASASRRPRQLRVDPEAVEAAPGLLDPAVREALRAAAANIAAVARAELEPRPRRRSRSSPRASGSSCAPSRSPHAGIYAPGGRAAYPVVAS